MSRVAVHCATVPRTYSADEEELTAGRRPPQTFVKNETSLPPRFRRKNSDVKRPTPICLNAVDSQKDVRRSTTFLETVELFLDIEKEMLDLKKTSTLFFPLVTLSASLGRYGPIKPSDDWNHVDPEKAVFLLGKNLYVELMSDDSPEDELPFESRHSEQNIEHQH